MFWVLFVFNVDKFRITVPVKALKYLFKTLHIVSLLRAILHMFIIAFSL